MCEMESLLTEDGGCRGGPQGDPVAFLSSLSLPLFPSFPSSHPLHQVHFICVPWFSCAHLVLSIDFLKYFRTNDLFASLKGWGLPLKIMLRELKQLYIKKEIENVKLIAHCFKFISQSYSVYIQTFFLASQCYAFCVLLFLNVFYCKNNIN